MGHLALSANNAAPLGVTGINPGVHYARLIDFEGDGQPEILIIYGVADPSGDVWGLRADVYGYRGGQADRLFGHSINIAGTGTIDINLAADGFGRYYLVSYSLGGNPRSGTIDFHTIHNGEWVLPLSLELDNAGDAGNWEDLFFINGIPASEAAFRTAHVTELGIVWQMGRINYWYTDNPNFVEYVMYNNPESVQMVLNELNI